MFARISLIAATLTVAFAGTAAAQERTMNGRYVGGAGERPSRITEAGTTSGNLGFEPYSGSYLPRSSGPLANSASDAEIKRMITDGFGECNLVHQIIKDNANKDTAAKFDAAGNPGFRERYLREGYDTTAEGWTGFCHNWAPAGLDGAVNLMVSMDRIYMDVPFGISDMREITTFILPRTTGTAWFGKRHNDKDSAEKPEDELDPVDLLTMMENYIGKDKPGLVLDVDPGYMVWNQPVYKWSREATEVSGADAGPKKAPSDGKAYKVKLTATYGVEGHYGYRGETISRDISWNMYVYTDKSGKIVDSAWDGYNKIPDFAWSHVGPRRDTPEWKAMKKIAEEGVSVKDIEEFCKTMAALPAGAISEENATKLKGLLDKICPVLDQNKLTDYVRKTAERTGQDFSVLEDAIRSGSEAHS
jgi:hypothetical protein